MRLVPEVGLRCERDGTEPVRVRGAEVTRPGDPKRFRSPRTPSPIRYSAPPPGEQRKMKRLLGERKDAAIVRARAMPWWPRVRITQPSSTQAYWIWVLFPLDNQAAK